MQQPVSDQPNSVSVASAATGGEGSSGPTAQPLIDLQPQRTRRTSSKKKDKKEKKDKTSTMAATPVLDSASHVSVSREDEDELPSLKAPISKKKRQPRKIPLNTSTSRSSVADDEIIAQLRGTKTINFNNILIYYF
jgi:hypothetical protein